MKFVCGVGREQLLQMLWKTLQKEKAQWKPKFYSGHVQMCATGQQRDWAASWLVSINRKFQFTPETVALSLSLLDRFLNLVKVHPKYLHCVAICCFYIAAKMQEEDEIIPTTAALVEESHCGCSVSEVLRMEKEILTKLEWNLKSVTSIDFLHLIHGIFVSWYPHLCLGNMTPSHQLALLTTKVFCCLCSYRFLAFSPSTLTLAVISLELEQYTAHWLPFTIMLQRMTEMKSENLISCREECSQLLVSRSRQSILSPHKMNTGRKRVCMKRKVEQIEVDEIYDSIKHLYNEEDNVEKTSMVVSCGSEVRQDDGSYSQVQTIAAN